MKQTNTLLTALLVLAGTHSSYAATVFTDTFNYTTANAFIAEGGWTTVTGTIDTDIGSVSTDGGYMWGYNGSLEYNDTATTVAEGDVITMNANVRRAGYPYVMTLDLWDGVTTATRSQVDTTSQTPPTAALTELSYTVTAADISAGRDHVIFHYGHAANWGETADVTFGITAVPEPSSAALLGLSGLAFILRRRK